MGEVLAGFFRMVCMASAVDHSLLALKSLTKFVIGFVSPCEEGLRAFWLWRGLKRGRAMIATVGSPVVGS